jgi:hypothetical protein
VGGELIAALPGPLIETDKWNDSGANLVSSGWSLALIGNASGQTFLCGGDLDPRRFR